MTYFFVLGTNATLSFAEIVSFFPTQSKFRLLNKNILLLDSDEELFLEKILLSLGGTIKVGIIFDTLMNTKTEFIVNKVRNVLKPGVNKYKFGISYYGDKKINLKPIGMEIKKALKNIDVSCRWVTSKEKILSSVVVEQNKLISKGIELSIIEDGGKYHLGKTIAVQPFKTLSFRDFGRPSRDDQSGMLPPKLAQIMINLAQVKKDDTILDPFCGSGTVLTEALAMGYENIIGSDISAKAINNSKNNINWLKRRFDITTKAPTLNQISATELLKKIKPLSISAIISEPFLGQQRGKVDFKKQTKELEILYSKALQEFKKILKPNGTIVILFPVFLNKYSINPNISGYKIINAIPAEFQKNKLIKITKRNTIIYGRSGQKVFREIVILKK
jgi:tRNA G10  N-methylase Trm11